ncbi:hypothetical protein RND71_009632 [Anisodus tanguticus]|uniref:Uncharacterized protein n=1 Tax=Anisodus tanguticus TaxID=243964 RepID=A0AAE1SIP0_9SOLA|nr:hypothetical protein RND71_009632 [Anisodus tanguticus]
MIRRRSCVKRLFTIHNSTINHHPFMAITSTFTVGPKDSFLLSNNNKGFQFLSCVKFLSTASTSIDPQCGGGGGKYPFNNWTNLRLWGCCSNDSNISCAGNNNKYMNGFQRAQVLLHDAMEASTSSATKDTNNNSSHRGSCGGFFNQDLHDKIVVAVDVDEVLGNFVSALNEFVADRYSSYHLVSEYHVYEFFKFLSLPSPISFSFLHSTVFAFSHLFFLPALFSLRLRLLLLYYCISCSTFSSHVLAPTLLLFLFLHASTSAYALLASAPPTSISLLVLSLETLLLSACHFSDIRVHEFFKTSYFKTGIRPIPGARQTLQKLSRFCNLSIVTSRQNAIKDHTIEWIERHYPGLFQDMHFGNHFALNGQSIAKSDMCRPLKRFLLSLGATVLIDDNPRYAIECAKVGIKVLLFDYENSYPWSKSESLNGHPMVRKVHNWGEVEHQLASWIVPRNSSPK